MSFLNTGNFNVGNAITIAGATTFMSSSGTTETLSGVISNSISTGSVTVAGAGTLVLSGANQYGGGTTIESGSTLKLTNNTGAGIGSITMQAGSTLGLNNVSITNTVSGSGDPNISVAGASSMPTYTGGAGTTFNVLGGDNSATTDVVTVVTPNATYAGTTNVGGTAAGSSVTLKGARTNAFGSMSTISIFAGSVLDLGGFNQAIGSLSGAGTVTNSGALGNSTLTIGGGTATTFSGAITDGSAVRTGLFLSNAGTSLTLTGTSTYTGATSVDAGATLEVDGSISASRVIVGGTLTGTGTVGRTQINAGGAFAPGNGTPGTSMTIAGNLVFQSGALYLVQLNPSAASSANITGSVTLTGGVVSVLFAPGTYVMRSYDILHAAGGLGGTTFSQLTANVPAGFTASLSSNAADTDVLLNLTANIGGPPPGPPPPGGLVGQLNQNQQNVADALNNFFNSGRALPPSFLGVFNLTGTDLANTLSQLSGEAAVDAKKGAFDLMTQFLDLMLDPTLDGRGSPGGAMDFASMGFASAPGAGLPSDVALAYAGVLRKAPPWGGAGPGLDQRWSVWGSAFGGSNSTKGDAVPGTHDVTAGDFGFAGGADYRMSRDTVVGFALAGGGTNWGLAQGLGGGRSDAFLAGIYGTTHWGPAYLALGAAFADHWFTTNRAAAFADQLTASFNGQNVGAALETGYRYAVPGPVGIVGITPYAALRWQWFHTPAHSETDLTGGGFGLNYAAMDANDTRSQLGARFDETTRLLGAVPLVLRSRLAWSHDWVRDPALGAIFQALPGASFTVHGVASPKDSALAAASAELKLSSNLSLTGKFDGEFARGSQTYAGTGTLRWSW